MKKSLLTFFFFYLLQTAFCQQPYWQQQVNYKIDVSLNDVENSLDGFVKMEYYNHSPDTLSFIWIHLWPNAYKNDRTAFTEQELENGSTDFYFSAETQRGYINRLDFKVNGSTAKTTDHPLHQDIIKLILPQPLAPGTMVKIETPFHVKLPFNFSRSGHVGQAYMATQWYPKPAVYDRKGWHPIPYLDQGEFYSEFGNYEVQLTVPANYKVAATGSLQESGEKKDLLRNNNYNDDPDKKKHKYNAIIKKNSAVNNTTGTSTKTLHYLQNNVHDFAWFADKDFLVKHDSLRLASGKVIDLYAFYYPDKNDTWQNCISFMKQAILTKSKWLGEYPYPIVTVVDEAGKKGGGMEYPTITLLSSGGSERSLDEVINHEIGHNWFYGILASNERTHPWMDEGMNTYYDDRYAVQQYGENSRALPAPIPGFIRNKFPVKPEHTFLETLIGMKKDQPIATSSEKFTKANYNLVAYTKTGEWMKMLEDELGKPLFDSCMREYYRRWQFKHPYPEDFKKVMEETSGKNLDHDFALLMQKGELPNKRIKKDLRVSAVFSMKETDKHNYLFVSPGLGYNFYDKHMFGLVFHNYTLPPAKFQFVLAPLYSPTSKQMNGIGRFSYTWLPGNSGQSVIASLSAETFSMDDFMDSANVMHFLRFSKIVPSLKYVFANKNPRSTISKFVQWKTFIIKEQQLLYIRDTALQEDIISFPTRTRMINQLKLVLENNRALYPYSAILQADQGDGFVRAGFTGNYFFNYAKGGGMNVRFFAGKFFYLGDKTSLKQFTTDAYHLNMTGPKGYEDFTYSDYFIGRNEYDHFLSQQIMIRDGGFKVRTDLLSNKIGKTDNWLTAINLTSDIPREINPLSILPVKLPVRAFLDIGTYAEAWQKNAETGRFVYDAGLQLSLFKDIINIYVPLLYSKVYRDYIKSTIPDNPFIKNIAFSINLQNISLRKMIPQLSF